LKAEIIGQFADIKADKIVVGFPGPGLIGLIAAKHIAYDLDLNVMGYLRSPLIPPQSSFIDAILAYPYSLYGNEDESIAVIVGQYPLIDIANYYFADAILDFAEKQRCKDIIILDGFSFEENVLKNPNSVYLIAEPDVWKKEKKLAELKNAIALNPDNEGEIDRISGYIGGVAGALLNESIIRPIDGYALLAPCERSKVQEPNPAGAAAIIKAINELINLEIDVKGLFNLGKRLARKFDSLAQKTHESQTNSTSLSSQYEKRKNQLYQ